MDVRESGELELSKLDDNNVIRLPLSEMQQWIDRVIEDDDDDMIDQTKPIICMVQTACEFNAFEMSELAHLTILFLIIISVITAYDRGSLP